MLRLYDTATREVRELATRETGTVDIYLCGPTVYGPPHIGHGRQNVVYDVLVRYLRWSGLQVRMVSNVTDIDDQIINRANAEGRPWQDIDRLIRGCNPAPGAWSTLDGKTVKIFDATPLPAKDPKGIAGKMGEIVAVEADGFTVVCADGRFKVTRVQADGPKLGGGEWTKAANLAAGARLT